MPTLRELGSWAAFTALVALTTGTYWLLLPACVLAGGFLGLLMSELSD
jgi:hypothetical protein